MKDPLDRPHDSPAIRRYLKRHPDAADLDNEQFAQHVVRSAQRHLEALRDALDPTHNDPEK